MSTLFFLGSLLDHSLLTLLHYFIYIQARNLSFSPHLFFFLVQMSKDLFSGFAALQVLLGPRERKAQAGKLGQELEIWEFQINFLLHTFPL